MLILVSGEGLIISSTICNHAYVSIYRNTFFCVARVEA